MSVVMEAVDDRGQTLFRADVAVDFPALVVELKDVADGLAGVLVGQMVQESGDVIELEIAPRAAGQGRSRCTPGCLRRGTFSPWRQQQKKKRKSYYCPGSRWGG